MKIAQFFMKFPKFWTFLVNISDFYKDSPRTQVVVAGGFNVLGNGFLLSVSFAALFGYPWTPLLWIGAGFGHWMLFDMLRQTIQIVRRTK